MAEEAEYEKTMSEFDRLIGVERIKVFHMNDSKKPLGSRVDRHDHIGRGHLGIEPFRLLVNDPRFAKAAMIMETPKEGFEDGDDMDHLLEAGAWLRGRRCAVDEKRVPISSTSIRRAD